MKWSLLLPKWFGRKSNGEWILEMMIRIFVLVIFVFILIPNQMLPTNEMLAQEFLGVSLYAYVWTFIGLIVAVIVSIPLTKGIAWNIKGSVKK